MVFPSGAGLGYGEHKLNDPNRTSVPEKGNLKRIFLFYMTQAAKRRAYINRKTKKGKDDDKENRNGRAVFARIYGACAGTNAV
jgi:hypothetical protein